MIKFLDSILGTLRMGTELFVERLESRSHTLNTNRKNPDARIVKVFIEFVRRMRLAGHAAFEKRKCV
jgi:hypothetical protein